MADKYNFKSIYSQIKESIVNGTYNPGTLMPTEQAQANYYSVSRPTIAKVYDQLQDEGLVSKKKGLGTIVTYVNDKLNKEITLGLLLPGSGESEIFGIINDQILKLSEEHHFKCLWEGATASNADIRKNLIESCCDNYIGKKVDGILFSPLERVQDADEINNTICTKIKDNGIPLVLIDRDISPLPVKSPFDVVGLDNLSSGIQMADHMIGAGCTNILFFYRPNSAYSVKIRLHAVEGRVRESGLRFLEENDCCGIPEDLNYVSKLPIVKGKTGIICANDATAAVLMSSLNELGYRIGTDLLISGYDNMKYSEHLKCPLTTFEQPCQEIANISIELIMRQIQKSPTIPVFVTLQGRIIERESTRFI